MKLTKFCFVIIFISAIAGCEDKCKITNQYTYYKPVYSTTAEIRTVIGIQESKEVSNPGRIYVKGDLLLINEVGKGIHLFDNSNPANPINMSFINIPGNNDMAIVGNTLYADSFIDLVAIDITNLNDAKQVARLESFFDPNQFYFYNNQDNAFVTDWVRVDDITVFESECDIQFQPWGGFYYGDGIALQTGLYRLDSGPSNSSGSGGSIARFTVNGNHLYVLDGESLKTVDITSDKNPIADGVTKLSWDIETIFPFQDKLFVGSQSGMYIVGLSDPANPTILSKYAHLRSCDPVVVEGNFAYVTLRNGSQCAGFLNQLEVIDITDVFNPSQVAVYNMTNPYGLGIDQGLLFICDGNDGLKIYDASDIMAIDENQLAHYKNIHAFDVIPFNQIAILIGETGLFQYDYSDIENIKLISSIPFVK